MKQFIVQTLLYSISVIIAAYIVPGVVVSGLGGAILFALVLGVLNATLGVILKLMTFPLNILSLGLVWGVINVMMILLVDSLLTSFNTTGFWMAAIFAVILTVVHSFIGNIAKK